MASPLQKLSPGQTHKFIIPRKRINEGQDVSAFLVSYAYRDITCFLVQLNRAMFPHQEDGTSPKPSGIKAFDSDSSHVAFSDSVIRVKELIEALEAMVDDVPLDLGPRRFGNIAFRKWFDLVQDRASTLLKEHLPASVISFPHQTSTEDSLAELQAYLLGSFGSSQRLDYGTGHELSFLAFLACIWKLGGFEASKGGNEERGIVLGILKPYLHLVRKLILKYSLEPAGSHGVWGLDDHSFLPYIFGSAQYGPAIRDSDPTPTEGSRSNAPDPGNVARANLIEKERHRNMYFDAIGFIYDVKKGPFWEHSPTLFDISGVKAGWAKINKGMLKMYDAEVLSKFPVIQHFPFGSLFSWERDPEAKTPMTTIHTASQPTKQAQASSSAGSSAQPPLQGTQAPWIKPSSHLTSSTPAGSAPFGKRETKAEPINRPANSMPPPTKAPWAK